MWKTDKFDSLFVYMALVIVHVVVICAVSDSVKGRQKMQLNFTVRW